MVERHNELLRSQLHLVDEQCQRDGLLVTDTAILDEAVLALQDRIWTPEPDAC